jgi:hypothetical protein
MSLKGFSLCIRFGVVRDDGGVAKYVRKYIVCVVVQ